MSIAELNVGNYSQVKEWATTALYANVVPFIVGAAGVGKSSLNMEIAKAHNLYPIDIRLSMLESSDLQGLPDIKGERAVFKPFNLFPLEDTPIPDGKDGFLIILEELNSANKATLAASYKLILDRYVGDRKLHPKARIMCTGNRMMDKAITSNLGSALDLRLIHLQLQPTTEETLEYFFKSGFDARITTFLAQYPECLITPLADKQVNRASACPRTYEFLSKLLKYIPNDKLDANLPLIAGTIGSDNALRFVESAKHSSEIPNLSEVLDGSAELPKTLTGKWATVCWLVSMTKTENVKELLGYVSKFTEDFRVFYLKNVLSLLGKDIVKTNANVRNEALALGAALFT